MDAAAADIIAHRGACAYLPEHSLAAKALAYGMGADYLEQDVVASRDGALLVLHDLWLDDVSDVARRFPDRARADGHFYCIDFDLDEIRTLGLHERIDPDTGQARYPARFPPGARRHRVVTLDEEIHFIHRLNASTGRNVGIYPEIKHPVWHRQQGVELGGRLLDLLQAQDYLNGNRRIFLQCFDSEELKSIHQRVGAGLPLIQLLSSRTTVDRPLLDEIRSYAAGIGPSLRLIYRGNTADGTPDLSGLVGNAHAAGLVVHPYTFRADALPAGIASLDELLQLFFGQLRVDGVFTDFTDCVAQFLGR